MRDALLDPVCRPTRTPVGGCTPGRRSRYCPGHNAKSASHQRGKLWHGGLPRPFSCEESYPFRRLLSGLLINNKFLVTCQDLAGPYTYPNRDSNVGLAQGMREHVQVTFPVRAGLPFLCMFSIACFTVGRTRKWVFWLCPSGCCTRP
jgi:hypothetical protein